MIIFNEKKVTTFVGKKSLYVKHMGFDIV